MNMKENDWVIANINNPEMNAGDFRVAGMDMDNTQMLSIMLHCRNTRLSHLLVTDSSMTCLIIDATKKIMHR